MISGILITAKRHMHVSQSWDLYTEMKTNMLKLFVRVFLKKLKLGPGWGPVKSDVLLLN